DRSALRSAVRLLRGALRTRGWVRIRKDHGTLVDPRHGLDDAAVEATADGAKADDRCGPELLDRARQVDDRSAALREGALVVMHRLAVRGDQALAIEERDARTRLIGRESLIAHRAHEKLRDARRRRAGAAEKERIEG